MNCLSTHHPPCYIYLEFEGGARDEKKSKISILYHIARGHGIYKSVPGAGMHGNSKWPHVALFVCGASHSVPVLDPCRAESLAAAATTATPSFIRKAQCSQPTPPSQHWKTLTTSNARCKRIPQLFRDIQISNSGNNQKGKDQLQRGLS